MNAFENNLTLQIRGYKCLENIEHYNTHKRKASVVFKNLDDLNLFCKLDSLGCAESEFQVNPNQVIPFSKMNFQQVVGKNIPVIFNSVHGSNYSFVWTLDELLAKSDYRINPPDDYFIAEINYRNGDHPAHEIIQNYHQILTLAQLLCEFADHKTSSDHVIYLGSAKFEMTLNYSATDICQLTGVELLNKELREPDHHHSQRLEVFRNTLISSLTPIPSEKRICHLFSHYKEFHDRYRRDFQIYAQDFTATRQIEEISKKQLELTEKIDSIIASLQNRVLAIPITFVVAAGQFSIEKTAVIQNSMILIGWLIFSIFVVIMIWNQGSTVGSLKKEVVRLREFADTINIYNDVSEKFINLKKSLFRQKFILWLVGGITLSITILISVLYLKYSYPDAYQAIWCYFTSREISIETALKYFFIQG